MKPCWMGADPGKDGCLSIVTDDAFTFVDVPTVELQNAKGEEKKVYDYALMARRGEELIAAYRSRGYRIMGVALEQFQPRPNQNSVSTGWAGAGWGLMRMLVQCNGIQVYETPASVWKTKIFKNTGIPVKLTVAPGQKVSDYARDMAAKNASRMLVKQYFPQQQEPFERVMDHNRAEAVLLGVYLRDFILGGRQ